ncbi:MAG: helix-turn-helix transcriptional regulator, partial [Bacillota bacterium]
MPTSKNVHHTELGESIRSLRIQKGLKIIDVAKATGLTSSLISQVERAIIAPSIDTLKKIAAVLDKPLGFFFTSSDMDKALPAVPEVVTVAKSSPVVHPDER